MYKLNLSSFTKEEKVVFKLMYNGYPLSIYDIHRVIYNDNELLKLSKAISYDSMDYVIRVSFLILENTIDELINKNLLSNMDNKFTLHQDIIEFKRSYMLKRIPYI